MKVQPEVKQLVDRLRSDIARKDAQIDRLNDMIAAQKAKDSPQKVRIHNAFEFGVGFGLGFGIVALGGLFCLYVITQLMMIE